MKRFTLIGLLVGLYMAISGAYNAYIEAGVTGVPTPVTLAILKSNPPSNRNVIVSGARILGDEAVVFYKTHFSVKEAGSEVYFIPLQDASVMQNRTLSPPALLRVRIAKLDSFKNTLRATPGQIHCIRLTKWDLEYAAKNRLVSRFGEAAVSSMVILEYDKEVKGVAAGLGKLAIGLLVLGIVLYFRVNG
jgi:hypothetical protein